MTSIGLSGNLPGPKGCYAKNGIVYYNYGGSASACSTYYPCICKGGNPRAGGVCMVVSASTNGMSVAVGSCTTKNNCDFMVKSQTGLSTKVTCSGTTAAPAKGCMVGTKCTSHVAAPAPAPAPGNMDITKMNAALSKCGITLSAAPCKPKGVAIKSVETDTKLSGVTVAQFDTKAQTAFKKGLAKTAGVTDSQVVITSYKATSRRSAGLEVKTQITLMGSDTSKSSSLKTKLSDKATLQKNIKAADSSSALASATVTSSSSKDGFTVQGDGVASSSSRSKGISAAVLISTAVVVASSLFSA